MRYLMCANCSKSVKFNEYKLVEKSDLMRLTCGSSIFDVTPLLFLLFAPDDPFPDVDVLAPAEVVLFLRESAPPPFLLAFPAFRFSFRVRWNSLPDLAPDWVVAGLATNTIFPVCFFTANGAIENSAVT